MTTSSRKPPSLEAQNALLGDLESIRSLLEPDAARAARRMEPLEDEIPTLDDVVDGADDDDLPSLAPKRGSAIVEPSAARGSAIVEPSAARGSTITKPPAGLPDDAFDALLGDEWRDAADRILEDARSRLDERAGQWSTDDANDFMEALQDRLNSVVHGWLAEVVRRELEDLRETLTAAIELEIDAFSMRMKDDLLDEKEGDAE